MSKPEIEVDPHAGFCFGVTRVVNRAEELIRQYGELYCLGEIVHNQKEIERLEKMGLKTITYGQFLELSHCRVLIRAHGEPPETYRHAQLNHIELIDGTCPIVLRLQSRIRKDHQDHDGTQIVIFGKKDHAEVRGLAGQTGYRSVIVESEEDLDKIDFRGNVHLYAQTTMNPEKYDQLKKKIIQRSAETGAEPSAVQCTRSVCGQVSGRIHGLKQFCADHDVILFVSYAQSSNGRLLFSQCRSVNENTYLVTGVDEVKPVWFDGARHVGITGATSTPRWLLEEFALHIDRMSG